MHSVYRSSANEIMLKKIKDTWPYHTIEFVYRILIFQYLDKNSWEWAQTNENGTEMEQGLQALSWNQVFKRCLKQKEIASRHPKKAYNSNKQTTTDN